MKLSAEFPLALLISMVSTQTPEVKPSEFKGKAVPQSTIPYTQQPGRALPQPLGQELRLGGATFSLSKDRGKLRVATTAGGSTRVAAKPGRAYTFRWRDGTERRTVPIRFMIDVDGSWQYFIARAYEFEIAGQVMRIVDCDGNGSFTEFERDGYCVGTSNVVCPLQREFVLGAHIVKIESLSPEGDLLVASLTPVEGTPQQVESLLQLNRLRTANGLSPVFLDPKLSAACTSHAKYLDINGWNGLTNPHDQLLGPMGSSPEGKDAAKRSNIVLHSTTAAVRSFWRTYYHRIGFMHPELSRIGVNSEPEHIAVIDVFDGYENDGKEPWPWADPVTVPSSGSAALPVTAYAELPSEPVPNLGSRGCPIMLFFRHGHPQLSEFSGSLQEAKGRRVVDVPCLVADRGDFPNVYGIVPQEPLKSGTSYVAEFSYTSAGEVVRKSIHFKTE